MALSISEQLQIIDGEINISQKSIFDLIRQAAIDEAKVFQLTHKVASEQSNYNGHNYILKMKRTISRLYKNDFSLIEFLTRITVGLMSEGDITVEAISSYTETEYLDLINANIYPAMEQISEIWHEEIYDYNAI